jgi:hypothetical protein
VEYWPSPQQFVGDVTYVTGVDRTEYQDGRANNFSVGIDYVVAGDSPRTLELAATRFAGIPLSFD